MLVTESFFKSGLPGKQIVDSHRNVESIIAQLRAAVEQGRPAPPL